MILPIYKRAIIDDLPLPLNECMGGVPVGLDGGEPDLAALVLLLPHVAHHTDALLLAVKAVRTSSDHMILWSDRSLMWISIHA